MVRTIVLTFRAMSIFVLRPSSRLSFSFGILILLISAGTTTLGRAGFGLRLVAYAFGFFVIGFITYIFELKRGVEKSN
jgi:hypothetical protein